MASWVQICNKSLRRVGNYRIQSLDESNEAARSCKDVYEAVRDTVLARHPWNAALVRTTLAADATAPTWGYERAFTLPSDPYCLRVWRLDEYSHPAAEWKVVGRKIHTDESAPLKIEYISRITDPEQLPPFLADLISAEIASEIAFRLSESNTKAETLRTWAEQEMRHARSMDGQEGASERIIADDFIAERY